MAELPWFVRSEAREMTHGKPVPKIAAPRGVDNGPGALAAHLASGPYGGPPARHRFANGGDIGSGAPLLVGPVKSVVAGRTDHVMTKVPADAYVIPADVVSGLGEGNTENGLAVLGKMFPNSTAPTTQGNPVDVALAGGEFVVSPQDVADRGGGDLKTGHKILDSFTKQSRAKHVKTISKLPGPHK